MTKNFWSCVEFVCCYLLCLFRPFHLKVLQGPAYSNAEALSWKYFLFLGKGSRIPCPEMKTLHGFALSWEGREQRMRFNQATALLTQFVWELRSDNSHRGRFLPCWWCVLPLTPCFWVPLGGGWWIPNFDLLLSCLLQPCWPWRPRRFPSAVPQQLVGASCSPSW